MFQDRKWEEFSSRALTVKWASQVFIDVLASHGSQETIMDFTEAPQDSQNEILNRVLDTSPTHRIPPNPLTLILTEKGSLGKKGNS